jgi:hypothetical protein
MANPDDKQKKINKTIRIISSVTLVNALVVGCGVIFKTTELLAIFAGLNAAAAVVTQMISFIITIDDE